MAYDLFSLVDSRGGLLRPRFLGLSDGPWLARLRDVLLASDGLRRTDVEGRLERPLYQETRAARSLATDALLGTVRFCTTGAAPPRAVRAALFSLAARQAALGRPLEAVSRTALLAEAAHDLGLASAQEVEEALYGDIPGEQRLCLHEPLPSVEATVALANLLLLQRLLASAERLTVSAAAASRSVVRFAKLARLIVLVREAASPAAEHAPGHTASLDADSRQLPHATLEISGPLSLLRPTRKYGHALARFLPALMPVPDWRLSATCVVGKRRGELVLQSGQASIASHRPPRAFDSKVEERLYRDLLARPGPWRMEREPLPLRAGEHLIFPDFGLTHADGRRVLVEVIGFWHPEYLRRKLDGLRLAQRADLLLCVDETLAIGSTELPGERTLRYRKRIDATALLALAERVAKR